MEQDTRDILLVEDSPADVTLLQHAFREHGNPHWRVHRVADGEAALALLNQEGFYAGLPQPHLVILDIRLPGLGGWEVLKAIRATPALTNLPVAMITGFISLRDQERQAELQPRALFQKPSVLEQYSLLVQELEKLLR